MLDTALFTASDLLAATLDVIDRGSPDIVPTKKSEAALTKAVDRLDALIDTCLMEGTDKTLTDALEVLYDRDKPNACSLLEQTIELAASSALTPDGRLCEMVLVPVLVSKDTSHLTLPTPQGLALAEVLKTHYAVRGYSKVAVSRRLRNPEEVYRLKFSEVYALNTTDTLDFRHLASTRVDEFNHQLWHPTLRFLMVHLERKMGDVLEAFDDDADEGAGQADSEVLSEHASKQALATKLGQILAVPYGTPLLCAADSNLYAARSEGMRMYAHKVAHLSIERQLTAAGGLPVTEVMVTYHTPEDEGEDSEVTQARVAIIGENAKILAGHVIESNDWFTADMVTDLLGSICGWVGLAGLQQAPEIIEIQEENIAPFFCNGETWEQLAPDSLRVEQEKIA
jgi:hypothetical protein